MSRWRWALPRVAACAVMLSVATLGGWGLSAQGRASGAELPEGPGVEVARARCLACHDADMIVGQRLSEAGWGREVDKMVRWGARLPDADRAPLVAYLSAHFAPAPATSRDTASGEAVFQRACRACHAEDIVSGQRLSEAAWAREVEKMVRWGASVGEAEKPALAAFLAERYPVR